MTATALTVSEAHQYGHPTRRVTIQAAYLDRFLVGLLMALEIAKGETLRPVPLMKVHEHPLFQLRLSVVDCYRVVMSVEAVNKGLYGGLVDVADVRSGLPSLTACDESMGVDKAESINDNLSLHTLNGVNHNGDRTRVQGFEGLGSNLSSRSVPGKKAAEYVPVVC